MKKFRIPALFIISVSLFTGFKQDNYPQELKVSNLSSYEVRFTHTGYIALHGTLESCPIRSNGKVILTGTLSGAENVDPDNPDDPVLYTGVLDLNIDMDICSVKRMANGEDRICGMTVIGNGRVRTEVEVSNPSTTNQVAYIKINYDSTLGRFQKSVGGTCDQPQQAEEEYMIPNETIASIFNGRDLPMLRNRTLIVGRYEERDGLHVTVVEVIRRVR